MAGKSFGRRRSALSGLEAHSPGQSGLEARPPRPGGLEARPPKLGAKRISAKKKAALMERVRRYALSLPKASEQDHWGRPSFRVGKRIFATLWPDEGRAMVKLTPEQQEEWEEAEPGVFFPVPDGWGLQGATFVELAAADREAVERALLMAWRNIVPKRVAQEYESRGR